MFHPLRPVEKVLRYRFKNRELLECALTHPSYRHEGAELGQSDNQRLEFLGDAVLGFLSAESLFEGQPDLQEGPMTKFRSNLTNRTHLAKVGKGWGIGQFLRMGKGETNSGGAERESNLADMVEAVVGAVYMDGGFKAARKFFARHFQEDLNHMISSGQEEDNPKGTLQEYTQSHHKCSPAYEVINETGPSHNRVYEAQVSLEDQVLATGKGSSKRTAEADAARNALAILEKQE